MEVADILMECGEPDNCLIAAHKMLDSDAIVVMVAQNSNPDFVQTKIYFIIKLYNYKFYRFYKNIFYY